MAKKLCNFYFWEWKVVYLTLKTFAKQENGFVPENVVEFDANGGRNVN